MSFHKRMFLYLFILLLILSVYNDLTIGTHLFNHNKPNQIQQTEERKPKERLNIVQVKVQSGDTVLSITEHLNTQLVELDITQIITDFMLINPNTDPYDIQPNTTYYFPLYVLQSYP